MMTLAAVSVLLQAGGTPAHAVRSELGTDSQAGNSPKC